ncbi:MAG TPA: histidine kinase [Lacunisphaera sp.]|nr:histidine kinase [Lacunisphaera sp.]
MPDTTRPTSSAAPARLSFWQLQLAGWSGFLLLTLPLKWVVYGSLPAALLITACQLPLSLALSGMLRAYFLRLHLQLPGRVPGVSVLLILAGCAVAGAIDLLVSIPVNRFVGLFASDELLRSGLFFFRTAVYVIWSLAYFLIKSLLANRAQAFAAAVAAERHRFELMRYQLNPRFVADSLAAISHEIAANPAGAVAMTTQLADYCRNTARQADRQAPTTIGDEIALVRAFLELERLRQPRAVRVTLEVDESLLALPLPPVLLLPLAERAVRDGRGTPDRPLEIAVTVRRQPGDLVLLEVANSGRLHDSRPPLAVPAAAAAPDVVASLERHFPGRYRFALSQDSLMVRATLLLPLGLRQSP